MANSAAQPGYVYELERIESAEPETFVDEAIQEAMADVPSATSLRTARGLVREAVQRYLPVKFLISNALARNATRRDVTGADVSRELNGILWDSLSQLSVDLTQRDRNTILDALKLQSTLGAIDDNINESNRKHYFHALVESFWPLQCLDVAITTLVLLAEAKLSLSDPRVPHWLCVIARDQLHAIDGALFRNSPVLHRRLREPGPTITTAELKRRLGL